MNYKSDRIIAVDLFCGAGGLTRGLINRNVHVCAGIDSDSDCEFPFRENNAASFLNSDICKVSSGEINNLFKVSSCRLIAGCAPCQPFSTYSQKNNASNSDARWELLSEFGRIVKEVKPEFVAMENVPQLAKHPVFHGFLSILADYTVCSTIVDCMDYGVPQTRKRLILLASRLGPISLVKPSGVKIKDITVKRAISSLEPLAAGQTSLSDHLHTASSLSDLNLKRIQSSMPGGTWRDWPQSLRADCHERHTGTTYPSVYGRMEWDKPAPTITTQFFGYGNGRFGHPEQDRAISLREGAILQTFPKDYQFVPPGERVRFSTLGRLIGNAVPVRIGEVIADSFYLHLNRL